MSGRLALIGGSSLSDSELPSGDWEVLQRHGPPGTYVLPHLIDHVANLRSLAAAGCDRVLAIASVGSLHQELEPGTMLCPDDFVALDAPPLTALDDSSAHRVPGFDTPWRVEVLGAMATAGVEVGDGGVYWQAAGPRLETPAEIRLAAAHADVIGMTIASECVVAGEVGLRYAALCVVDNLANGVGDRKLTLEQIDRNRAANRAAVDRALQAILPRPAD